MVQMSSGAFDARDHASPATGVNVRALRKRAHSRKSVRSCTLMQSDSEAKAPCLQLPAKSVICGKISGNRTKLAEVAAVAMVKRCRRCDSTSERAA
jgi:hypothetical protein